VLTKHQPRAGTLLRRLVWPV